MYLHAQHFLQKDGSKHFHSRIRDLHRFAGNLYTSPQCTGSMIYLTNRFHVAVHLSSNRSQMTSKCGKNKNVAHEAIAECVTDVLTTF